MQTVVLAAGEGTRMRPLTRTRPKPLLPVAGQTLVEHTLEAARMAGASRFVVVSGYRGEEVRSALGDDYGGVPVVYVDQGDPEGTADAVAAARPELADEPFVVLNGDCLYDAPSLAALYDAGPAVGAKRVDDPSNYGVLETVDDRVTGVIEKPADPPSNLASVGAYVFPATARDWLDVDPSERGERELTDVLTRVIENAAVTPVPVDRWLDVGRPWELLAANEWKLAGLDRDVSGDVADDATVSGRVVVEVGATVESGVVIEGPVLVRSGATVGPNAYVRGSTVLCEDVHVGHAVEVKNSVLFPGAHAAHLSYVGDSVLGAETNLGAGTTVANLRHDEAPVRLTVKDDRVSTGRRKFGVVLGDRAKTAIDTSLNAGVTMGVGATTAPGESVTRDR
ncbi:glucose-1-phosphate thymidylyltransferase [Halobacteriales archaeon SW_7_71_33]|nr:MAG: glucose-1-phosphate thymidylyltransferase [Halobacteriales archaeon SW_7_71_33]